MDTETRDDNGDAVNGYWCHCGAGWILNMVDGQWAWVKLPERCWATLGSHDDSHPRTAPITRSISSSVMPGNIGNTSTRRQYSIAVSDP